MSWLDRGKWVSGKKVHYQSDVGALIWKANRLDPVGLSRARWRDQACSVRSLWVLFPFRGKVDVNKRGSLIYLASISGCSVCGGRRQWWVRHSSDLEKALIRGRLAEGAALSCVRPPTEIAVGTFAASTSQFPTELSGIIHLFHGVCAAEVAWIHWLWYAATQSPESESAVSPLWAVLFLFIFCLWWGWGVRHVREGGKKRETKNWWGWGRGREPELAKKLELCLCSVLRVTVICRDEQSYVFERPRMIRRIIFKRYLFCLFTYKNNLCSMQNTWNMENAHILSRKCKNRIG